MYWHVLISAIVWFPLGVMIICYSAIFLKLDRYEQKVLRRENPISVSYKTKVAKMMFTVLVVFVLLRVPFTTLIFIRNQMLKETKVNQVQGAFTTLWYCSHYLMFCNAAINPIIYGLTNDNFRKAYRQTPLIRLFCKSTALAATKGKGQGSVAKERKQRIQNMLLDQSDQKSKVKHSHAQSTQLDESSLDTSTSNIWHTKKTNLEGSSTKARVISTNLSDCTAADPGDYEIMESSESHVDDDVPVGQREKGISADNFI